MRRGSTVNVYVKAMSLYSLFLNVPRTQAAIRSRVTGKTRVPEKKVPRRVRNPMRGRDEGSLKSSNTPAATCEQAVLARRVPLHLAQGSGMKWRE